ncbi:ribonuclease HII [Piscinibacterium candidicorallinum]|uniref:Ribonuclease HII n=1 Tax=Piscinibacterium candidicorallinum TaxID=1793872 RepID=A0ABV7H351_9BURK
MPRKPAAGAARLDLFAALPVQGVCGVDEAGRGPLAGSVFTGAVILDPSRPIEGLRDSKQLTEARREALAELIRERALAWAVASASVEEIDRLNILQATLLAMRRAVLALKLAPELVLVDGNRLPALPMEARAIVKGDALVPAISAASILAKCARDAEARELHVAYPGYGFDLHKGYGTELHMARLQELGACPAHRASFAPVREALERAGVVMIAAPSAW